MIGLDANEDSNRAVQHISAKFAGKSNRMVSVGVPSDNGLNSLIVCKIDENPPLDRGVELFRLCFA